VTAPLTVRQLAQRWQKPARTVRRWCELGVFPGAFQVGNRWAIPLRAVLVREGEETANSP